MVASKLVMTSGSGDAVQVGPWGEWSLADELNADRVEAALFGGQRERRVGRYVPIQRVGRGAFGAVYAAHDPQLDRRVALKIVRSRRKTSSQRARMLREARALAAVNHPNVVRALDVGETEAGIFIAMEFIEGTGLGTWLRKTRPSHGVLIEILVGIARGLEAAHAAGLAHRDVKPDNIMITADGVPLIVDFGLAKAAVQPSADGEERPPAPADDLTRTGTVLGTPAYMSPEQHRGQPGSSASDQFSFCVLAYEAFVGERPYEGTDLAELRAALEAGRPTPPPRGAMPKWFWPVLERGLSTDPDRRFPSMGALLDALAQGRRRRDRLRLLFAGGGLLAVVVAASGVQQLGRDAHAADCRAEAGVISESWSAGQRATVRRSLLSLRDPDLAEGTPQLLTQLDAAAAAWTKHRVQACLEARVDGTRDEAQLEHARTCLDGERDQLELAVAELQLGDPQIVEHVAATAARLSGPSPCLRAAPTPANL